VTSHPSANMTRLTYWQAFAGFTNRLTTVVFDNAFVIQGNRCTHFVICAWSAQLGMLS
jgi:hypothetical protein